MGREPSRALHLPLPPVPMGQPALLDLALITASQEAGPLGGTAGPDLTRYFAVCGVLILATLGLAWGLRRLVTGNLKVRAAQRSLHIVDVLNLGGKRKLAVVRCYDRTFVLGLGEREVTPVAELDPVIGTETPAAPAAASDRQAFARALEQVRTSLPPSEVGKPAEPLPPKTKKVVRKKKAKATARPQAEAPRAKATAKGAESKRKREAVAVAEAARRIAENKIKREGTEEARSKLRHKAAQSARRDASAAGAPAEAAHNETERPQLPRLEGIVG